MLATAETGLWVQRGLGTFCLLFKCFYDKSRRRRKEHAEGLVSRGLPRSLARWAQVEGPGTGHQENELP